MNEPCDIQPLGKGGSKDDTVETMPTPAEVLEVNEIPPSQPRDALMLQSPPSPEHLAVPAAPDPSKVGSSKIRFESNRDIQRAVVTMKVYLEFAPSHPITL